MLQLVLKLTLLKVFLYHLCAVHVDNMSAKIKLSANKNEGATSHDRLKNVDTVPLARNFPITRACETSDGASLARNELHASLPLATDAPIISAFLLVCSRVNRESLAKYKFLKRYDAEKKLLV